MKWLPTRIHVAAEWRNLPGSNNILISDWLVVGGARPDFAELDACVPGSTYIVDLGTTF